MYINKDDKEDFSIETVIIFRYGLSTDDSQDIQSTYRSLVMTKNSKTIVLPVKILLMDIITHRNLK